MKRTKAQYTCELTGDDCPFNDSVWEYSGARAYAQGYCPVHKYEASDDDTGEIGVINDFCRHAEEKPQPKRGRPRADYNCAVSGRVCPLRYDDVWAWGGADSAAQDSCPIQAFEKEENYRDENGVLHISDFCKHLLPREQ